ncbi:DUF2190 family protein [Paenibacillus sp. HN-1]|uniref:DUF2190 family protein n=1 Tax=Paenibacillus TaxID=44249 RepID=UPI001CAA2793|nr:MULTISPECIES: DUF2190 family protein [Paenibacillus]MBY9081003.1 DUF2190 family protein [Paenibacillus sp. CGMCC 1.18879]MBY9084105.1 DUF2190 family protein [Paenibacillus sinensis]
MTFRGQPVPTTYTPVGRAKVSDGKSVNVTVPASTAVVAETFVLLDGFFGVAKQSVTTGVGETASVILDIEQAEFETDQISTSQVFAVGTAVYWNATTSKFTETATDNRLVGRVTVAKDANNVIWFLLGPQL